jgi:hypothetical protein
MQDNVIMVFAWLLSEIAHRLPTAGSMVQLAITVASNRLMYSIIFNLNHILMPLPNYQPMTAGHYQ